MQKFITGVVVVTLASILLLMLWLAEVLPRRDTSVRNNSGAFPTQRI